MSAAEAMLSPSGSWTSPALSWINVADTDPPPLPYNYENGRPAPPAPAPAPPPSPAAPPPARATAPTLTTALPPPAPPPPPASGVRGESEGLDVPPPGSTPTFRSTAAGEDNAGSSSKGFWNSAVSDFMALLPHGIPDEGGEMSDSETSDGPDSRRGSLDGAGGGGGAGWHNVSGGWQFGMSDGAEETGTAGVGIGAGAGNGRAEQMLPATSSTIILNPGLLASYDSQRL